jgi:hypothetical protein
MSHVTSERAGWQQVQWSGPNVSTVGRTEHYANRCYAEMVAPMLALWDHTKRLRLLYRICTTRRPSPALATPASTRSAAERSRARRVEDLPSSGGARRRIAANPQLVATRADRRGGRACPADWRSAGLRRNPSLVIAYAVVDNSRLPVSLHGDLDSGYSGRKMSLRRPLASGERSVSCAIAVA